jgi:hypothetical protein
MAGVAEVLRLYGGKGGYCSAPGNRSVAAIAILSTEPRPGTRDDERLAE